MKQQFEVGDKAIWKGGKVTNAPSRYVYPKGTEIFYKWLSSHDTMPYRFLFPDMEEWSVSLDQIELPTTPTTIVTVHGNPDWKPEKGEQIGWKIIEWFPMEKYKKQSVEECFKVHGYHFGIEHECIEDWSPASNPKHFAPVYKEAKPIEFVKILNQSSEFVCCQGVDYNFSQIVLLEHGYTFDGLDLMYGVREGDVCLFLGHFNSGTI